MLRERITPPLSLPKKIYSRAAMTPLERRTSAVSPTAAGTSRSPSCPEDDSETMPMHADKEQDTSLAGPPHPSSAVVPPLYPCVLKIPEDSGDEVEEVDISQFVPHKGKFMEDDIPSFDLVVSLKTTPEVPICKLRTVRLAGSVIKSPFVDPFLNIDRGIASNYVRKWMESYGDLEYAEAYNNKESDCCYCQDVASFIRGGGVSSSILGILMSLFASYVGGNEKYMIMKPNEVLYGLKDSLSAMKRFVPYLFNKSLKEARWLFIPLNGEEEQHWWLACVDLLEGKVNVYNSMKKHYKYRPLTEKKMSVLTKVLCARIDNVKFKSMRINWVSDIPKQVESLDCGLFVLRYMYSVVTETDPKFTQEDVKGDRELLAYAMLIDDSNLVKQNMPVDV